MICCPQVAKKSVISGLKLFSSQLSLSLYQNWTELVLTTIPLPTVFILITSAYLLFLFILTDCLFLHPFLPVSPLHAVPLSAALVFDPAMPEPGTDPGPAREVSTPWETENLPGDRGRRDGGLNQILITFHLINWDEALLTCGLVSHDSALTV